jgi:hypothetical protein
LEVIEQAAVAVIVGGLSAYVSGRLAVRRALDEFKGVRAAERGLDWYEHMSEALKDHQQALLGLVAFPRRETPEHREFIDELIEANQRVGHHMARAMLFAPQSAIAALESLDFEPLTRKVLRLSESPEGLFPSAEALDHIKEADRVRGMLAEHYRASLGLDRLSFERGGADEPEG